MRSLSSTIKPIEHVFSLGLFRPASVQRNFQWDPERAERLLTEIQAQARLAASLEADTDGDAAVATEAETDTVDEAAAPSFVPETVADDSGALTDFYIGELVLHKYQVDCFDIYDGLQRLTCLTILAAVLRDLIADPVLKTRLAACVASGPGYRLAHPSFGKTLEDFVQKPEAARIQRKGSSRPKDEVGERVFDIQVRFAKMLNRYKEPQLVLIATHLLERVSASILETGNPVLARHIFVAKNLYGLPLSRDEVFKGQLLALAGDTTEAAEMEAIWNRVRDEIGVREVKGSRIVSSASEMERFLTALDLIWRKKEQGTDALGNLIDRLGKSAPEQRKSFMVAMQSYAKAWIRLHDYLARPQGSEPAIRNHVWRLRFFKWDEWLPLALHWIERFGALSAQKNIYGKTRRRMELLHRRCMAITLYEFGTRSRQEMFAKAIGLATQKTPREPFGRSSVAYPLPLEFSNRVRLDVQNALRQPIEDYEVRRTLLLWYEASLWDDEAPGLIGGGSVEHLLPNNPAPTSQWMKDFADADERYWSHGSLGNLTLVDHKLQEELGNLDFANKKPILERASQFTKYRCTADLAAMTQWKSAEIAARTKVMADRCWNAMELRPPKISPPEPDSPPDPAA